jgi:hypothetical protein
MPEARFSRKGTLGSSVNRGSPTPQPTARRAYLHMSPSGPKGAGKFHVRVMTATKSNTPLRQTRRLDRGADKSSINRPWASSGLYWLSGSRVCLQTKVSDPLDDGTPFSTRRHPCTRVAHARTPVLIHDAPQLPSAGYGVRTLFAIRRHHPRPDLPVRPHSFGSNLFLLGVLHIVYLTKLLRITEPQSVLLIIDSALRPFKPRPPHGLLASRKLGD